MAGQEAVRFWGRKWAESDCTKKTGKKSRNRTWTGTGTGSGTGLEFGFEQEPERKQNQERNRVQATAPLRGSGKRARTSFP